jgi:hypothetical protein
MVSLRLTNSLNEAGSEVSYLSLRIVAQQKSLAL